MNVNFINLMIPKKFFDNIISSLTDTQKKTIAIAVGVFSCIALAYHFYRFCNFKASTLGSTDSIDTPKNSNSNTPKGKFNPLEEKKCMILNTETKESSGKQKSISKSDIIDEKKSTADLVDLKISFASNPKSSFQIFISPNTTVANIKEKVSEKEGVAVDELRIMFCGKMLQDDQTLKDCGISEPSQLYYTVVCKGD